MTEIECVKEIKEIIERRMNDNENNIINVHVLRSYKAARLNCDGVGNIKTITYNGVDRTFCSSAAIKNGQKEYIKKLYKGLDIGRDTRRIGELILAEYLRDYFKKETGVELSDDEEDRILLILKNVFKDGNDKSDSKCNKKPKKSSSESISITTKESNKYSVNEIKCIADTFIEFFKTVDDFSNKKLQTNFKDEVIVRIGKLHSCGHLLCLLGRMSTCFIKTINSSVSVAGAFSVIEEAYNSSYQSRRETVFGNKYDPYKNPGAANLFDIDISSPLLLEEYSIDIDQMIENEMRYNGIETREGARELARLIIGIYMEAIYWSNPTGGRNSYYSESEPILMYVTFGQRRNTYDKDFRIPAKDPTDALNTFIDSAIIRSNEGIKEEKKKLFLCPSYFDKKEEFGLTDENVSVTYKEKDIMDFVKENI